MNQNEAYSCLCARTKHTHAYGPALACPYYYRSEVDVVRFILVAAITDVRYTHADELLWVCRRSPVSAD